MSADEFLLAQRAATFAAAWMEAEAALDWELLGELYCHEGGESFFPPEQVEALREAGLSLASALASELAKLPRSGPRTSLYFGAALAELPLFLADTLICERRVRAINLPSPEADELNRVLAAVEDRLGESLPRIETGPFEPAEGERWDCVWMTSVLTDPEAFPALHDVLYGRRGGELATGRGDEAAERDRARDLLEPLLAGLVAPGLFITTDEELELIRPTSRSVGLALRVPTAARLSAIVGDPIRICNVTTT